MKPVAPDLVFLVECERNGIEIRLDGKALVKGGVENRRLGGVGEDRARYLDTHQVSGVVQRRQGNARLDVSDDPIIDQGGCLKGIASVDDPMADGRDLRWVADDTRVGIHQEVHDPLQALLVIGDPALLHMLFLFSCGRHVHVREDAAGFPDFFGQARGHDLVVGHLEELIFDRGTSGIHHKNEHDVTSIPSHPSTPSGHVYGPFADLAR